MVKPLKTKAVSHQSNKRVIELLAQARALVSNDHLLQASDIYKALLELDSNCLEALHVLGSIEFHFKNFENSLKLLIRATAVQSKQPKNGQLQLLLGKCAKQLGQFDLAQKSLKEAIFLDKHLAEAYVELGLLFFELGDLGSATEQLMRALKIAPENFDALNNLGIVLKEKGDFAQSLSCYDQAILLDSTSPTPYVNRGVLFHMLGRFEEARIDLDRAIELAPQNATAHISKGQLLLTLGEYSQGWEEFEWRWEFLENNQRSTAKYHNHPLWSGRESLVGKRILLFAEQGLGDSLQFCRYVSLVAQLGGKVTLECQAPLLELFKSLDGVHELRVQQTPSQNEIHEDFDFQCPLMSLPRVFSTTLESIPNNVPYLQADPHKVADWKVKLGPKFKPRVGLVWSGGVRTGQSESWAVPERRNIALAAFELLADLPVEFFSLQKGTSAEAELTNLAARKWGGPVIANNSKELADFSDTAALIANLDLVISVDTSTAHLSAALGKSTWILNRYDTCWRWLLIRSDSPWYPSVTLYRQAELGNWDPVIEQVRSDLLKIYAE